MSNRKHSKVDALPEKILAAVKKLLIDGATIKDVLAHLKELADQGKVDEEALPSKSGVGRFAKNYTEAMARLMLHKDYALDLVKEMEGNGLALEQAASSLLVNDIIAAQIKGGGKMEAKDIARFSMAVAKLQSSSASRERAKIEMQKEMERRAKKQVAKIGKDLKADGIPQATIDEIKEKFLGVLK